MNGVRTWFSASDEQLMWRVARHDDAAAFARLVERWQQPIRRLAVRMTGDEQHGEDVAQEAFTRVFARRRNYRPDAKFSTYLWRVALNLCRDELRRAHHRREVPQESDDDGSLAFAPAPDLTPDAQVTRDEQSECVRRALRELPEHYRSVVVLRHYEDLKFREIADVLGVPEGTVKSRMAEALTQLERRLRPVLDDTPKPRNAEGILI